MMALETAGNDGFAVSTAGNTGAGDATFRGGITFGSGGVFLRALDQITDVSVLSNPKLLTLNRQRARILVGRKVAYLETSVDQGVAMQTVKWLDTGITMDVRPYVLKDGRVRLMLAPKISKAEFRRVVDNQGVSQEVPDEDIQTVATDILVPRGGTAIIGGLFREQTTKARSQVPRLGDAKWIGAAFRGHDDTIEKTEIIFMIKPTVLTEAELLDIGKRGFQYADTLLVGSRMGLLPWSREKQCGQLNLRASRLAAEGKTAEAAWLLGRSLQLKQMQPEALRLRERLTMSAAEWESPSLLEKAVRQGLPLAVPPKPAANRPPAKKVVPKKTDAKKAAPKKAAAKKAPPAKAESAASPAGGKKVRP